MFTSASQRKWKDKGDIAATCSGSNFQVWGLDPKKKQRRTDFPAGESLEFARTNVWGTRRIPSQKVFGVQHKRTRHTSTSVSVEEADSDFTRRGRGQEPRGRACQKQTTRKRSSGCSTCAIGKASRKQHSCIHIDPRECNLKKKKVGTIMQCTMRPRSDNKFLFSFSLSIRTAAMRRTLLTIACSRAQGVPINQSACPICTCVAHAFLHAIRRQYCAMLCNPFKPRLCNYPPLMYPFIFEPLS